MKFHFIIQLSEQLVYKTIDSERPFYSKIRGTNAKNSDRNRHFRVCSAAKAFRFARSGCATQRALEFHRGLINIKTAGNEFEL